MNRVILMEEDGKGRAEEWKPPFPPQIEIPVAIDMTAEYPSDDDVIIYDRTERVIDDAVVYERRMLWKIPQPCRFQDLQLRVAPNTGGIEWNQDVVAAVFRANGRPIATVNRTEVFALLLFWYHQCRQADEPSDTVMELNALTVDAISKYGEAAVQLGPTEAQ